jgi:hypothetical protein
LIDSLSIILSTLACVFVVYRAVQLDRILPRFEQFAAAPIQAAKSAWTAPWATPPVDVASPAATAEPAWTPPWG